MKLRLAYRNIYIYGMEFESDRLSRLEYVYDLSCQVKQNTILEWFVTPLKAFLNISDKMMVCLVGLDDFGLSTYFPWLSWPVFRM